MNVLSGIRAKARVRVGSRVRVRGRLAGSELGPGHCAKVLG